MKHTNNHRLIMFRALLRIITSILLMSMPSQQLINTSILNRLKPMFNPNLKPIM